MSRKRSATTRARAPRRHATSRWTDRIHAAGVWLIASVALVLPIAFDPSAEVAFAMPKAEALGVLAYAIGACVLLALVAEGWGVIPRSPIHFAVAAYLVVLVLASVVAIDRTMALWGAYDRRLGLISSIQLAVVYLGAATFVRTRSDAIVVLGTAVAGGIAVVAYGMLQVTGHDPVRWTEVGFASSSLGNSNPFGMYAATLAAGSLAALLALFPWRPRRGMAVALAAATLLFVGGTIMSSARAPMLGFAAAAMVAVAMAGARMWQGRGRRAVVGLAAAMTAIGVAVLVFTPVGARLALLVSGSDTSVRERTLIYELIVRVVRDHPILGVGPDNLAAVVNAYRPLEQLQFGALVTQSSEHGWPWRVALDTGIVGAIVFAGLLATVAVVVVRGLRAGDWRVPVLAIVLVAYFGAGVFTVDHQGTEWLPWLAFGMLVGAQETAVISQPHRAPRNLPILAGLLALGLLWPLAALVNDISASRTLVASRGAPVPGGAALSLAQKAVDADDRWTAHWNNLGLRAIDAGDRAKALAAFERAAAVGPYDPLIWKNLGTVQAQLSKTQPDLAAKARESARRAGAADPNNPEAHAGAIQIYLLVGDTDPAAAEADRAMAAGTSDPKILDLVAHAYYQAKRYDETLAIVARALPSGETVERRLLLARAYIGLGRYADARAQLERTLQLDPKDQTAPALLAQIAGR